MTSVLLPVVAFCGIVLFVAFVAVVMRPEIAVYAYLVLWITVPKALRLVYLTGGVYDFPEGVTVFNILEGVVALAIVVTLLAKGRGKGDDPRSLAPFKRLTLLLLLTAVATLAASSGVLQSFFLSDADRVWRFIAERVPSQYRWLPVLSILYAAIFLFGFARFIRSRRQLQPVLWIFAISGVELALERVLFVNFNFFGSLDRYAVENTGRFKSLVFTSYDIAGVFAILALASSLCLALRGRRLAWGCLALSWIPIIGGYQRAVLMGGLAVVGVTVWRVAGKRGRFLVATAAISLAVALTVTSYGDTFLRSTGGLLGGRVRSEYFATDQIAVRLALWKRSIDVIAYMVPFGTGPGATGEAMNYPIRDVDPLDYSPVASSIYASLASGTRRTNPHNLFFAFSLEYGVAGMLLMLTFLGHLAVLFRRRIRLCDVANDGDRWRFSAQSVGFAMLLSLGVHGFFEATPLPYFIYLLPVALIGVTLDSAAGPPAAASTPVPDVREPLGATVG